MAIHILGIRHHGVGSAQNLQKELERIQPDLVLVEGAPELTEALQYVGNENLVPPVALMAYDESNLDDCIFYPFSEFSPEWVAVDYANRNTIPVRAMDLPAAISFAQKKKNKPEEDTENQEDNHEHTFQKDPLSVIAEAFDFPSGDAWWEHHFEQNKANSQEHFQAVMLVMQTLRNEKLKSVLEEENVFREAYMRELIRKAENEMYENIVVVCGAWHAPALQNLESEAKNDTKILKSLPKSKTKIVSSWIPWTNERLSTFSGYGAGILSPGWYEHLWKHTKNTEIEWLTKIAHLLRNKGMDTSTAHIIETYQLARNLAILRGKHFISLQDLNEAVISVMLMGDAIVLELIKKELIVGNKIGSTPDDLPKVPLQNDFDQQLKKLRLKLSANPKQLTLDLRKDTDLEKSILFYRLELLGIGWAERRSTRSKGNFKEAWELVWKPEMMLHFVDKAYLGNTIEIASETLVKQQTADLKTIAEAAELIQNCIPAELFSAIDTLLQKIMELSTISADILDIIEAIPDLVEVSRYGNVRKSDSTMLKEIVENLLVKTFIGLGNACYGLDEENSLEMFEKIAQLNNSIALYDTPYFTQQWFEALHKMIDRDNIHPVIQGCINRLLLDAEEITTDEANIRISYALSVSNDPHSVAFWLEGFLKGSGSILIYDHRLWNLLYRWVDAIPSEIFMELLPLLRRTFSKFEYAERRQIGNKAKQGLVENNKIVENENLNFDTTKAREILPILQHLMGLDKTRTTNGK